MDDLRGDSRQCRNNHCLDTRLQGRMHDRQEPGIVVGRELVEPAYFFGFSVDVGVSAADKPEDRRRVPLPSKRTEILTRRCRPGLPDFVCGEMSPERIDNTLACVCVVDDELVVIERRDLRRPRRQQPHGRR
jgi:hypothetical protein